MPLCARAGEKQYFQIGPCFMFVGIGPLAFDESYGAGGDREGSSTERYERWMAAPQIYFADGAAAVERLRPLGAKMLMHGQASAAMLAASSPVCSEYWAVNMEDLSPPSYSAFA